NTVPYADVVAAINRLGIGMGGLRYDPGSHTLAISGDTDRVTKIKTLIENLESRKAQAPGNLGPEEVKVIPLRFTDVGPSTRQFQGKSVTVPGIADTLKQILGIDERPPATNG